MGWHWVSFSMVIDFIVNGIDDVASNWALLRSFEVGPLLFTPMNICNNWKRWGNSQGNTEDKEGSEVAHVSARVRVLSRNCRLELEFLTFQLLRL